MIDRPIRLLALGAAVLVALTACTAAPGVEPDPTTPGPSTSQSAPADLAAFYAQDVTWRECSDDGGFFGGDDDTFECATITVPRDYDDPGAGTLELSAVRRLGENAQGSLRKKEMSVFIPTDLSGD